MLIIQSKVLCHGFRKLYLTVVFLIRQFEWIRPLLIILPRMERLKTIFLTDSLAIWADLDQFEIVRKPISKTEVAWNDYQKRGSTVFSFAFLIRLVSVKTNRWRGKSIGRYEVNSNAHRVTCHLCWDKLRKANLTFASLRLSIKKSLGSHVPWIS